MQKAACPHWVWWLKRGCGDSQVDLPGQQEGQHVPHPVLWACKCPSLLYSPSLLPELSMSGFPLCSFGFILSGSSFQSVFGCLSEAPRCAIFTENQWGLAIKCFHLSLLNMSPVNNKRKAEPCVWRGWGFANWLRAQAWPKEGQEDTAAAGAALAVQGLPPRKVHTALKTFIITKWGCCRSKTLNLLMSCIIKDHFIFSFY